MEIKEFSQKYFNGDMDKTLQYMAYEAYTLNYSLSQTEDNLTKLVDSLNQEETSKFMKYLAVEAKKNPQKINNAIDNAISISSMDLTIDEVKKAKVNPYKAKIGKSFFKFLVGTAGILGFVAIANSLGQADLATKLGTGAMTLFNSYVALDASSNIMKYFKFKKAREQILSNQKTFDEVEKGGKRL